MCECGDKYADHEKMRRGDEVIMPCIKFTKAANGRNASVCACKNFREAVSA